MSQAVTFLVPPEAAGERLDRWLADQFPDTTRSQVQKWIREGRVLVDGGSVSKGGVKLEGGERVTVFKPPPEPALPQPESISLDVLYEDDQVLVVNKPAGLVVHPAPGHRSGTLVNALLAHYPELAQGDTERPGIVHRLDKDTSGVLVVAKNTAALEFLQRQFRRREVQKEYLALVHGHPDSTRGIIGAPIGRDPRHRQRLWVVPDGRPATTEFEVIERFAGYTLLLVRPVTGRTHQIRVHLAAIGHPVVGDPVYGPRRSGRDLPLKRHFLHAWRLTLTLPDGRRMTFEAPLPPDLEETLAVLRTQR